MKLQLLENTFFLREDVVDQAKELLGCILFTKTDGHFTSGMIIETEAYAGINDKASHAYGGRRTARTETMFNAGGVAYVYLCYGMYHLFNVVTGPQDMPNAILIRAVEPLEGIEKMMQRRKLNTIKGLADGPGKLTIALGIDQRQNKMPIDGNNIGIARYHFATADAIHATPRIGVDYAGEDALLPYRFLLRL